MLHLWGSEDRLQESVFSFHLWVQTRVTRHGSGCPYWSKLLLVPLKLLLVKRSVTVERKLVNTTNWEDAPVPGETPQQPRALAAFPQDRVQFPAST